MLISDWSSDVCSSDLARHGRGRGRDGGRSGNDGHGGRGGRGGGVLCTRGLGGGGRLRIARGRAATGGQGEQAGEGGGGQAGQMGRGSWREHVCQDVDVSVVGDFLQKKTHKKLQ